MNIIEYIGKYKEKSFEEEKFNEVDNIVLSILSYLDFNKLVNENNTIKYVGKKFLEKYTYKEVSKLGIPQKDAYNCLKEVVNTKRYGNINIHLLYVAFEGTDNLMSGWKEDFQLSYMYPIPSQVHAIEYLNKTIKLFGPKVIVGGHSKGGNLALVSSMELNILKKLKIKKSEVL